MTVELPVHINRLQLPFSWHVAAELCWRVPGHRVYETRPAGGHYDCLSIRGPKLRVDINRGGSIHAHDASGDHEEPPVPLDQVRELSLMPDGVSRAVAAVLSRYRLAVGAKRPPTTAETLTYRVIAAALSMHFFRSHSDCRALVPGDEYAELPANPPAPELAAVPANEVWTLTRDGEPVAHVAYGWAVTPSGERLNLLASYDRGLSVEELAARVTAAPAARASDLSTISFAEREQQPADWPADI